MHDKSKYAQTTMRFKLGLQTYEICELFPSDIWNIEFSV